MKRTQENKLNQGFKSRWMSIRTDCGINDWCVYCFFLSWSINVISMIYHGMIIASGIKVGPSLSKENFFICFNISPLKMIKNAFHFIIKALFVLKIFKFLFWIFRQVGKTAWLENGMIKLILKFMTSQLG